MLETRDNSWSPVDPTAPATLAEAKAFLGITDNSADTLLTRLLAAAPRQIEAWCDAPLFGQRTVTETIYFEAQPAMLALSYRSVGGLSSLTLDGTAATLGDFDVLAGAGIVRRKDGGRIGGLKVVAVYTAGYATIPDELKQGALELVRAGYLATKRDGAVKSESVEGVGSVTYLSEGDFVIAGARGSLPLAAAGYLDPFKRTFAP